MTIGQKIASSVPEPVVTYFYDHPRVLTVVTGTLVVVSIALMLTADELDIRAHQFKSARLGEMQRSVSEALGG